MKNRTVLWLITAVSFILIGGIIFVGAMTALGWDFEKMSTVKYETVNYKIEEEFKSVSVNTKNAKIEILPADSSTASVVCYEQKNVCHSVEVKDGTLLINAEDTRKWYEYINIVFHQPKITVYLPVGEYGALALNSKSGDVTLSKGFEFESIDVSLTTGDVECCASSSGAVQLKTTTGDIDVRNIKAASLLLSVTTGKVNASGANVEGELTVNVDTGDAQLSDITCKKLISHGDTGDLALTGVKAKETFTIERDTGDVKLNGSDATDIFIVTDTGDVEGSLLTPKSFDVRSDTGKIEVPRGMTGGICKITTDTGDVILSVTGN